MLPEYKEGDFVVINKIPFFLRRLSKGDAIIFTHEYYGILIKKIDYVLPGGEFFVVGNHANSLDSTKLGNIPLSAIKGKVTWHIRKPKSRKL
jgi:signal peptidase I